MALQPADENLARVCRGRRQLDPEAQCRLFLLLFFFFFPFIFSIVNLGRSHLLPIAQFPLIPPRGPGPDVPPREADAREDLRPVPPPQPQRREHAIEPGSQIVPGETARKRDGELGREGQEMFGQGGNGPRDRDAGSPGGPAPRDGPAAGAAALHEGRDGPVGGAGGAEVVDGGGDAAEVAERGGVPLHARAQEQGFGDEAAHESGFAAGGDHFGGGAGAGGVGGAGFEGRGGEEGGGGRVEGGVCEGEGEAGGGEGGFWLVGGWILFGFRER